MKYVKFFIFSIVLIGIFLESCEFEEIEFQEPIPVALEATSITSSGFLASWSAVEGAESYTIQLSVDDAFDESSIVEGYPTTSNRTQFQVSGLEADKVYFYRVRVNSTNSRGSYSNIVTAKLLPLTPPQVITPTDVTPLSFLARWQSVPEAEGYLLYVSTNANFTEHLTKYDGKLVSDTTALVEGLQIEQDYFYRVRTVRGQSTSQPSALMRVSTSRLSKPTILNATEINFTSITVNWEAVEGATSYKVFVGTDRFAITDLLPEYSPRMVTDALSLAIVGLNANTTYYFRVQAVNNQSESENSDIGSASTVSLEPPVAYAGTNIQIDGFQANWDSVANASSYVLDISRNANFTDYLNGYRAKEVVDTFEIVTGLLRNTNYYYRVRSKGFGAVSENSAVITVQTTFFASPKALEAIELQPTSFRAVWQPVEAADSYRIDVASDANFDNILATYSNLATTDTTQLVTGLTENKRYFYRVRAIQGDVFSGYSNIVDLTTTRLSEPQLLATTEIGLTSFKINWRDVSGAVRYRVDVGFDPSVTTKIATDYDNRIVNGTFLVVSGLDANTTYYFKVRAENNVSTGGSSLGSAKTVSITPPVVENASDVQLTSFQANWNSVADAESYLLDVAIDMEFTNLVAGFNAREIFTVSGAVTVSEPVTGLQPDKTYYYRVRAKGLGSNSDYSSIVEVTTLPLPAPVTLAATDQETYQFTANWEAVTGADKYALYVATDASFSAGTILTDYNGKEVLGTSCPVSGLDPYTTYYYRLQSIQATTSSNFSATYATVNACILEDCRLVSRTFEGWRKEFYRYNSEGLIHKIELADLSDAAEPVIRETQISYDGGLISEAQVDTDQHWKFTYESYGVDQQRIKQILVEDLPATTSVTRISFTYNSSGKIRQLLIEDGVVSLTPSADTVFTTAREENYTYGSNTISVRDESNILVKEMNLSSYYNSEALLASDLAVLLFNPTNPDEFLFPFVTEQSPEYYRYYDEAAGSWRNYPYSYEFNAKQVPTKVRATYDIPDLTYQFSNCGF